MKLFDWFQRIPPRGIHSGEAAAEWASTRFPPHLQPMAAFVADLLCEQVGLNLSSIEATSTFAVDLRMADLEPVEFVMALEHELGIVIPHDDCARLETVSSLVSYLHERLSSNSRTAYPVNEDIPIRFRWTPDELLSAYRWHFRHRIRPVFRGAFWFLAAAFVVIGSFQWWESRSLFPGGMLLLVGIYIPIMFFVLRPWLLRRQFARRPDRDTEVEWRISADSIHARGAHGTSDFTWRAIAKVVQTPAGFLFYPTEQIFHWLPRHGFASDTDFDRVSHLAQQHATAFHRTA